MKTKRNKVASEGFTLLELMVVMAIIAILIALLLPVLAIARRKAKEVATISTIKNFEHALTHYRQDWQGSYPIIQLPLAENGQIDAGYENMDTSTAFWRESIFDQGDGNFWPGFFQVACAAIGSPNPPASTLPAITSLTEYPVGGPGQGWQAAAGDNGPLIRKLVNNGYMKVDQVSIINDRLVDAFNNTIVARFLIVPSPIYDAAGVITQKLEVKTLIWSYGYDGLNHINAKPVVVYSQPSVNSDYTQSYDYQEYQNIINSTPSPSDPSNYNVISWARTQ